MRRLTVGGSGRAPAFGVAVMTPILLAGVVSAAPERPSAGPAPAAETRPAAARPPSPGPKGDTRIPPVAMSAYRKAETTMTTLAPGCGMSWNLLAGISRIESPGIAGATGIRTVAARTPDPTKSPSWLRFPSDGDGDGKSDPHNPFDATLATARHLCSNGLDLSNRAQALTALLRYNNSMAFVENVLGWAAAYATGIVPLNLPPIYGPVPILPPRAIGASGEPQLLVLGTTSQAGLMLPPPPAYVPMLPDPPPLTLPTQTWTGSPAVTSAPPPGSTNLGPVVAPPEPPPVSIPGDLPGNRPSSGSANLGGGNVAGGNTGAGNVGGGNAGRTRGNGSPAQAGGGNADGGGQKPGGQRGRKSSG